MLGIPAYLYRLVPANPILLRVVSVAGKRRRDLIVRSAYLGLLIFLVIFALIGAGELGGDLDKLSRTSTDIFVQLSYLQLALVSLLAPIFTAGAITQEKDSQTYDILLSTPLTNGQIVLGTLLSRLFFVFALLLSGIPIFSITQIFGGVAFGDVLMSCAIAGVTALVTGALAVAIATFKVGTRRTIFSFYMVIVVYLVGLFLLDRLAWFHPGTLDPNTNRYDRPADTSWLTGIHPFLALRSILDPVGYAPPALSELQPDTALRSWPLRWYFTNPAGFFVTAGTLVSFLLVAPSIAMLRRMAQSTVTVKAWVMRRLSFLPGVRATVNRKPRGVWNNPIAWREAKTKASATRAGLLRYTFILAGLVGAVVVCIFYATEAETPRRFVTPGSYDFTTQTLSIAGDPNSPFRFPPTAQLYIDGDVAELSEIEGRWAVTGSDYETIGGLKTISRLDLKGIPRRLSMNDARRFLLGMVFLEVAVILLIVTNAAASTVTREKEDGTLDLLLSTPITSRYYIWGKLRGLVSFALPLIIVPVISCLVFILYDLFAGVANRRQDWLVLPEALVLMPILLVVLVAFASIVGMNLSLRQKTTVRAVMISLAIVIGLFALLGWCGFELVTGTDQEVGLVFGAFSPLTVIMLLINPDQYGGGIFFQGDAGRIFQARVIVFLFSLAACGAYAAIIWAMYKSMVKNFDMTIRRQQR